MLDALAGANGKETQKQATVDDARKFLSAAMEAGVVKKSDSGGLVETKRKSERVMSFSAAMGGTFGGADAVHRPRSRTDHEPVC